MNYDFELRRYQELLLRAAGVRVGDRVLDVGCGAGQTTRDAARAASAGDALGVDVSAVAVRRARELAAGLENVAFEQGDAQVYRFPPGRFDIVVSRFGTMFFADPVAAFNNIGRALRPDGRLVMLVWQGGDRNEWDVAIRESLEVAASGGPDPFSLGDPVTVREILATAGFADIAIDEAREPVYYGPDVDAAFQWVRGFAYTSKVLHELDAAGATRAEERLRRMLAAHSTGDGVQFDSRAWIVTARLFGFE